MPNSTVVLASVLLLGLGAWGCDSSPAATTNSASSSPAKSGAAKVSSGALAPANSVPTASASATASSAGGDPCKAIGATAGTGSAEDPCKLPDAKVTGTYTGKGGKHGLVFEVDNKLPFELGYVSLRIAFYDKDGNQLEFVGGGGKSWLYSASGGVSFYDPSDKLTRIKPGKQTVEVGPLAEKLPANTETVEIDFSKVGTKDEPEVYYAFSNCTIGNQGQRKKGCAP